MKTALVLSLGLLVGSLSHAQKAADDPKCSAIVAQCKAAGFEIGDHKKDGKIIGKGLWADCVHKVSKGKTIAGVTVSQADAKACQDVARADRMEKLKNK